MFDDVSKERIVSIKFELIVSGSNLFTMHKQHKSNQMKNAHRGAIDFSSDCNHFESLMENCTRKKTFALNTCLTVNDC
jgi:hypothetical protein